MKTCFFIVVTATGQTESKLCVFANSNGSHKFELLKRVHVKFLASLIVDKVVRLCRDLDLYKISVQILEVNPFQG